MQSWRYYILYFISFMWYIYKICQNLSCSFLYCLHLLYLLCLTYLLCISCLIFFRVSHTLLFKILNIKLRHKYIYHRRFYIGRIVKKFRLFFWATLQFREIRGREPTAEVPELPSKSLNCNLGNFQDWNFVAQKVFYSKKAAV